MKRGRGATRTACPHAPTRIPVVRCGRWPCPAARRPLPRIPAQGKALILIPLTLTKVDDLDFGTVVTSPVSGIVTINPTTGARAFAGGATGMVSDAGHRALFAGAGTRASRSSCSSPRRRP